jgi:hypothetical protein
VARGPSQRSRQANGRTRSPCDESLIFVDSISHDLICRTRSSIDTHYESVPLTASTNAASCQFGLLNITNPHPATAAELSTGVQSEHILNHL